MQILSKALNDVLVDLEPEKVAVAYVGAGWERFLSPRHLRCMVISPTIGSNPKAIYEITKLVGWDNVHFLDGLHSKMYIGKSRVMIGSANLSNNAFGLTRQEEACVVLEGAEVMASACTLFETYVSQAQEQYPTIKAKRDRLSRLRIEWNRAWSHGVLQDLEKRLIPSFGEYDPQRDGEIHVAWCCEGATEYTDAVAEAVLSDIVDEVHLAPDDLKPLDQWVLSWVATQKGGVHNGRKPVLMYVHEIFENGTHDPGYESLCVQRSSFDLPPKPFDEAEADFIEVFRRVISRDEFSALRGETNDVWRLVDKVGVTSRFWEALREEYAAKKAVLS